MKRFEFALEPLLRLRRQERRNAESNLLVARQAAGRLAAAMRAVHERLQQGVRAEQPGAALQEGVWLARQGQHLADLGSQLLAARKEAARCAQVFTVAQQREEAVLALRDRKKEAWRRTALRTEQAVLDEVGQRKKSDIFR
jgi:flagellar export protein FliJ